MSLFDSFKNKSLEKKLSKLAIELDTLAKCDEDFEVLDEIEEKMLNIKQKYRDTNTDIYDSANFILEIIPQAKILLTNWKHKRGE